MGTVNVKWVESHLVIGVDSKGEALVIGTDEERQPEWRGVKPSDLLLLSAAACSMYDVVAILRKQREPLAGLEVSCSGEQQPDPPHAFTSIHLHYKACGALNRDRLASAIRLSEEKYCSVVNTLKPAVKVTSDFEITGS